MIFLSKLNCCCWGFFCRNCCGYTFVSAWCSPMCFFFLHRCIIIKVAYKNYNYISRMRNDGSSRRSKTGALWRMKKVMETQSSGLRAMMLSITFIYSDMWIVYKMFLLLLLNIQKTCSWATKPCWLSTWVETWIMLKKQMEKVLWVNKKKSYEYKCRFHAFQKKSSCNSPFLQ